MKYEFVTYADGTKSTFSDIIKNEEGEETIHVNFERATKDGTDRVCFEAPSCIILVQEGNYTQKEIEIFKTVVERGYKSFVIGQKKAEFI